ncbi:MAG: hypothetical protein JSR34_04730 [Proteobacteria bacterium]|nr:hypothetical protein [Pseudomonadota bacterium]
MDSNDSFAATRWSVILQGAAGKTALGEHALGDLVQRYGYPVYACVRRCGHAPAIAQDITRLFLREIVATTATRRPAAGQRLRDFLLDRLQRFLGEDWRAGIEETRAADVWTPPVDLEARYQHDVPADASPGQAYQRTFALEVIARAVQRLQAEAAQTGHLPMFEALRAFIAREPPPGVLDGIGQRLRAPPLALLVALKRLRQRLRELTAQELADTVDSAAALDAELAALHAALRGRP